MPTLLLPVPLKDDERLTVAAKLSDALTALDGEKGKKKAATADFNAEIKTLDALIHSLNGSLITGTVEREIEIEERTDLFRGVVVTYRLDTGLAVKERPLDPEERQMKLGETVVPGPSGVVHNMADERARRAEEQNAAATPEEAEALRDQRLAQEAAERGDGPPPEVPPLLPEVGDIIDVRATEGGTWMETQVTVRTELSFQAAVDIRDDEEAPIFDLSQHGVSWRWPLEHPSWDDVKAESAERARQEELARIAADQARDAGPKTLLKRPPRKPPAAEPPAKVKKSPKNGRRVSVHDQEPPAPPADDDWA